MTLPPPFSPSNAPALVAEIDASLARTSQNGLLTPEARKDLINLFIVRYAPEIEDRSRGRLGVNQSEQNAAAAWMIKSLANLDRYFVAIYGGDTFFNASETEKIDRLTLDQSPPTVKIWLGSIGEQAREVVKEGIQSIEFFNRWKWTIAAGIALLIFLPAIAGTAQAVRKVA